MQLSIRPAIAAAIAMFAFTACGSTRFVVVDNQPRREVTTAPTRPGATSGTTATAPGPAGAADLAAIKKEISTVFSSEPKPLADRLARVVDGDDLGPTVEAVLKIVKSAGAVVTVDAATVANDSATAIVNVTVGGKPFASDLPVEMVRSDSTWRVTRAGVRGALAGEPLPRPGDAVTNETLPPRIIDPAADGAGPLRVAVALSGARCVLTYVVAPALSSIALVSALIGPIAVWLHLLAVGSLGYGTYRMWRGHRRGRVAYTALAVFVAFLSLAGVSAALA